MFGTWDWPKAIEKARINIDSLWAQLQKKITPRVHLAGLAMAGILLEPGSLESIDAVAKKRGLHSADVVGLAAVGYADALLAALGEGENDGH